MLWHEDEKLWQEGESSKPQTHELPVLNLIRELWEQSSPEHRCPHVRYNGTRCRCAAVDESAAESVCDTASLQLWCLDGERYPACHFYPKS